MNRQRPDRPNILLICADQWRGDCLSIDGHPVVHTPHLDHLASRGARFQRAYSATPSCIPARAALYTGLTQRSHGRVGYLDHVRWDYPVTIASEFSRAGYQTEAIGKMHVYPERARMGFDHVILHAALGGIRESRRKGVPQEMIDDYLPWLKLKMGASAETHEQGIESNSWLARPWDKPENLHYTNFVASESIDFFRRRDPSSPFFLFASFNAPHPPYDPPAWAFDQYIDQTMPDPPIGNWRDVFAADERPHIHNSHHGQIDPRWLQRTRAGYFGHMTHVDHQINRILYELRHNGLEESTYVCFLSDHGEMLGDHCMFQKTVPYEGSARIPMILVGPSDSGIAASSVHAAPVVELRDVMPTLLDCAGLPIPASVEGRSFLTIAKGEPLEGVGWREYLHGEHVRGDESIQWVTDGREKYVWFSGVGREQLFDLRNDPEERCDLTRSNADYSIDSRVQRWRDILIQELEGREEGFTNRGRLIPGRPVHPCLKALRDRI
jgi:arylsulfatase A-like enzyme